jgi:hypothetical protein
MESMKEDTLFRYICLNPNIMYNYNFFRSGEDSVKVREILVKTYILSLHTLRNLLIKKNRQSVYVDPNSAQRS